MIEHDPEKPRLLDAFCSAGGAGMGYHRAGFDVVGIDIRRQRRYPFAFVLGDAIDYIAQHGHEFAAIHASPPCQLYSASSNMVRATHGPRLWPDLIGPTREALLAAGRPYVIENVVGSPLRDAVQLCGSSFGRPLRRHRLFESSVGLLVPGCAHRQLTKSNRPTFPQQGEDRDRRSRYVGVYGSSRYAGELAIRKAAMGIDWMTGRELTQAIPPDYTDLIGQQLIRALDWPGAGRPAGGPHDVD